ncbi:MAG TPA: hypothetical protein DCY25_02230, partial [Bacteroidales bacterium]|nr:hypothetical protein [Bacteroidales bacterium]
MLLLFFILSVLVCLSMLIFRSKNITKILMVVYAVMHIGLSIYSFTRLDTTELGFFTYTGIGVLLLSVLSILAIPVVYHGFIY